MKDADSSVARHAVDEQSKSFLGAALEIHSYSKSTDSTCFSELSQSIGEMLNAGGAYECDGAVKL
ncbi:MAG TPA: hypothetical protein VFC39_00765 [Acidobacteriaceae bacterium]|nr:hypothetical protein [Acidobacteriaceae bacterium]